MPENLNEPRIKKAIREAAGSPRKELIDAGCRGLRFRPMRDKKTGTWSLACRDKFGRMRRFPLGNYPDMGVSEARTAARQQHGRIKYDGADPIAEGRLRRSLANGSETESSSLAGLLNVYAKQVGHRQKSWSEAQRRIEKVFRPQLTQPLAAVTARQLQITADGYPAVMSASAAVRYLRPVLKWAAQRGYVDERIASIHPPAPVKRRARVLNRAELASLLPVLRASDRPQAAAMLFMLLTLARRDEVADAQWRHIDLEAGLWTIEDTKNHEPHVIPLPRQALELIQARQPQQCDPNGLIFATGTGAPLGNWDRETKRVQTLSGVTDWHRHDLRRTGATLLGEMGELPDIVEAALNHTSIRSSLAATYNRSRYRPQVAVALQRLADRIDQITGGAIRDEQTP